MCFVHFQQGGNLNLVRLSKLEVPAEMQLLREVLAYTAGACARAGLPENKTRALLGAVDELFTNAVQHGARPTGVALSISAQAELGENGLTLFLEDNGGPFNPLVEGPAVDVSSPVESRAPGGLGLYLVKELVDELHYQRRNDRNRIRLQMNRE
jgi:serine/threonine-protein kinase RsbW